LWKDGAGKELRSEVIAHFFKLTMLSKCSITERDDNKLQKIIFFKKRKQNFILRLENEILIINL
jgi:hypothetical protein